MEGGNGYGTVSGSIRQRNIGSFSPLRGKESAVNLKIKGPLSRLGDLIEDENAILRVEATIQSNLRETTTRVLGSLRAREECIVRMRLGLGMNSDHTLQKVRQHFSVTRERIRRIEAKALRKLKHPSRSRMLRSFLDDGLAEEPNTVSCDVRQRAFYIISRRRIVEQWGSSNAPIAGANMRGGRPVCRSSSGATRSAKFVTKTMYSWNSRNVTIFTLMSEPKGDTSDTQP